MSERTPRRRRLTPSLIVAMLALALACTGGAFAASKYVISSTKQISPKVLKKLKGRRGARGPAGPAGVAGTNGTNGTNGTDGKNGATGERGPSDAIFFSHLSGVQLGADGAEHLEAFLTLPAGAFTVQAKLRLLTTGSGTGAVGCSIENGAGTELDFSAINMGASTLGRAALPLLAVVPASAADRDVKLVCNQFEQSGGSTMVVNVTNVKFIATQVGTLTNGS